MTPAGQESPALSAAQWQGVEHGYQRLSADQAELASYLAEARRWVDADTGSLAADAVDEYPESNS